MALRNSRMLIVGLLVVAALPASAQVFRCESPNGVPEYTNTPRDRCARLDLAPVTTIPVPVPRPTQSGSAGSGAGSTSSGNAPLRSGTTNGSIGLSVPGPSALRVDAATQKARDMDRRRILEEELAKEQARLEALRQEISAAESLQSMASLPLAKSPQPTQQPAQSEKTLQPAQRSIDRTAAGAAQSGQPKALDRTMRLREELGRTEGNLKALNREISSLKD